MLETEVRQEISHYRQLISTNSERITTHNRELAKLKELLTNLGSVQTKHNTKLAEKKHRLHLLSTCGVNPKLVGRIYDKTRAVLFGTQCDYASDGLEIALNKVKAKIRDVEGEISYLNSNIVNFKGHITYLNGLLTAL